MGCLIGSSLVREAIKVQNRIDAITMQMQHTMEPVTSILYRSRDNLMNQRNQLQNEAYREMY